MLHESMSITVSHRGRDQLLARPDVSCSSPLTNEEVHHRGNRVVCFVAVFACYGEEHDTSGRRERGPLRQLSG